MKSRIAAWLGLSWQELRGFALTLLAMTFVLALPYVIASVQENAIDNRAADEAALDSALAVMQTAASAERSNERAEAMDEIVPASEIKPFNPNALDAAAWVSLGLKPYLAERVVKYRTKVSPFRVKGDLLKVYGFPERLYQRLAPFILLPETNPMEKRHSAQPAVQENFSANQKEADYARKLPSKFDINTADTSQLTALRGIGAVTAARIIKFRDALGGFHSLAQLREVYAITPEALASLETYATLTPNSHRKIAINNADAETLRKHPYIGYKLAEVIVNYRRNHGAYKSPEDLQKIRALTPETLEKILPYLEF